MRGLYVQDLPVPEESFDWVGAHYMLYHVADISRALQEVWRGLKPGGILLAAANGKTNTENWSNSAIVSVGGWV